jgi:hypothetical protein
MLPCWCSLPLSRRSRTSGGSMTGEARVKATLNLSWNEFHSTQFDAVTASRPLEASS